MKQAEIRIQVITYIKVHRKSARELSARTRNKGQNQKVNIMINTTGRPNINNTHDKTNTGRRSDKIKTEKTNKHGPMKNMNTRLTGHRQGHGKQARPTSVRVLRWGAAGTPEVAPLGRAAGMPQVATLGRVAGTSPASPLRRALEHRWCHHSGGRQEHRR